MSPDGRHLGTVRLPEDPHNLAWGEVQRALEIDEYTDVHHPATVPHTVVLGPGRRRSATRRPAAAVAR